MILTRNNISIFTIHKGGTIEFRRRRELVQRRNSQLRLHWSWNMVRLQAETDQNLQALLRLAPTRICMKGTSGVESEALTFLSYPHLVIYYKADQQQRQMNHKPDISCTAAITRLSMAVLGLATHSRAYHLRDTLDAWQ